VEESIKKETIIDLLFKDYKKSTQKVEEKVQESVKLKDGKTFESSRIITKEDNQTVENKKADSNKTERIELNRTEKARSEDNRKHQEEKELANSNKNSEEQKVSAEHQKNQEILAQNTINNIINNQHNAEG
jgi:hypothetical protein